MSRSFTFSLAFRLAPLALLLAPAAWSGKEYPQQPGEQVVSNQLLVKLKAGAAPSAVISAFLPGAQYQQLNLANHFVVRGSIPPGISSLLAASPLVEFVEPNRVRRVNLSAPNDPLYSSGNQWGLFTVQAFQAWNFLNLQYLTAGAAGSGRIKVAVLDTGADCTHPDFKNSGGSSTDAAAGGQLVWSGSQAFTATTVASPTCSWQDDYGHGTHVSGLIAAATGNGAGVASLGFSLQVLEYKVLDVNGSGSDADIANAIIAAVSAGAKVISMSLGGAGYSATLQSAVDYAWNRNVVVVAAAGNNSSSVLFFPGGANHAVGVSATDVNNNLASFSNHGDYVGVAAPGVSVLSTLPTYPVTMCPSSACNYGNVSGTSMATPFVSALAGLVAATTPNVSAAAIVQRLQQTSASSAGGGAWSQSFGYGIINAYNAVSGTLRSTSFGGVSGQITDASGAVTGAQVNAGGHLFTTDSSGLYWFHNLPAGTYPVTVSASGYPAQSLDVTVTAGADTPLPVTMGISYGRFIGTVRDQGRPVAGAIVQASLAGVIAGTAVTDSNGQYSLWVAGGSGYSVQASEVGSSTATASGLTAGAGGSTTVDLTLPSLLGRIAGAAQNPDLSPIAGAQVVVSGPNFSATVVTDSNGNYAVGLVPLGAVYSVTASESTHSPATQNGVAVAADTTSTVNFQLARLPVAAPQFSLASGTYAEPMTLRITSTTAGASIRYTTDGSTPSSTAGTLYTGPITVSSTLTINAIAYSAGYDNSPVVGASYTVNANAWYSAGSIWSNRKLVTINHAQVAGALSGFPMLVSLTDANLQASAKADGSDILFTASDGVTKLSHEIEQYSAGQLTAWVNVPALSPTADTFVYLYYGNGSASPQQTPAAVWDANFKAVWHLGENANSTIADSTSNAVTGTKAATVSPVAGKIGGGQSSSSNGRFTFTAPSLGSFTISGWINIASQSAYGEVMSSAGTNGPGLFVQGGKLNFYAGGNHTATASVTNGAWHHVAAASNAGAMTFYLDGQPNGTASGIPAVAFANMFSDSADFITGNFDEFRISSTARSAAWLLTEYNNQNSPGAFITVGSQQTATSGTAVTIASAPAGLALTVDNSPCTAPCSFQWVQGSSHTIAAASQAGAAGTQYLFANWSDSGAASHTITAPASSATFTASFTTQYFLTTAVSPAASGSIAPASGWFNAGSVISVSATPAGGYQFSAFSGALSGATNPQNLTLNAAASVTATFSAVIGVTVTSSPAGLALTVDSSPCTAPCSFQWAQGSSHTVAAASQAGAAGTQYVFANWSDSGAASHTITAPASSATFTANFVTQYFLTTAVSPAASGSIAPASGWFNAGSVISVSATPASGYQFSAFSGALSGGATPQNLTLNAPASVTATFTAWYSTGGTWTSRKVITINHNQVGSSLSGFPLLISITDANLQASAKADGSDILFTASDGVTKLSHEIEQYSAGQLVAWVNLPFLSASADTPIYMYYGNAAASPQQTPAAVWDANFKAVWHLGDNPNSTIADSTSNAVSGTKASTVTPAAGKIGGGQSSSSNGRFTFTAPSLASFTVSGWINIASQSSYGEVFSSVGTNGPGLFVQGGTLNFYASGNHSANTTITTGAWHHVVAASNAGALTFYLDGQPNGTASGIPAVAFANMFSDSIDTITGNFDEFRISSTARSAAWVLTEYNNQNSPASFLTVGSQQTFSSGATVTVASSPAGLALTVDNSPCTAPCSFQWTQGTSHTIAAASQAGAAGTQYVFANWSDSGAASHTITAPASSATFTANFVTQYFLTTAVSPAASGSIAPASGWFNAGSVISVSATPASGAYQFSAFSGALSGATNPQNLTLNAPASVTATFTAWYNTGGTWTSRKVITINHNQVGSSLSGFPLLVSITDANLQASAKADGSDILFTASDGVTKLSHEIEQYSAGQIVAWVNLPFLSASADTPIYMYYGNASASPQQTPAAVWDANFKAVWHLGDNPNSTIADSTSNAVSGTKASTVSPVAGKIGGGQSSSSNGRFTFTAPSLASFTISGWINIASQSSYGEVFSSAGTNGPGLFVQGGKLNFYASGNHSANTTITTGAWHHVVAASNAGALTFYLDGQPNGTASGIPAVAFANMFSDSIDTITGNFDEFRISSTARSAAWILTEYNNQNNPASFLTAGTQEIQSLAVRTK